MNVFQAVPLIVALIGYGFGFFPKRIDPRIGHNIFLCGLVLFIHQRFLSPLPKQVNTPQEIWYYIFTGPWLIFALYCAIKAAMIVSQQRKKAS